MVIQVVYSYVLFYNKLLYNYITASIITFEIKIKMVHLNY